MNKLQEKAEPLKLGLYIHVPFCARSCDFCHFYQESPRRSEINRYLEGIEYSLRTSPPPRIAETAFWGGGTPGLLPEQDLQRLCRAMVKANHGVAPDEWTVEMAPSTIKPDKIKLLMNEGVSRISVGIQSFQPELLESLGRVHSLEQAEKAIDILKNSGMDNFNLDMIFCIPGQTLDTWQLDLDSAIRAQPAHISTYCLTFEEDTALWLRLQQGQVNRHTEEDEASFHELAWQVLGQSGYQQYEVSNHALRGMECVHNLNTWKMQEWIGYGPSAASQLGGLRWSQPHSLDEWLDLLKPGERQSADEIVLTDTVLAQDYLIFGLRMNKGVNLHRWQMRFGERPLPGWDLFSQQLVDEGLATVQGEYFRLTDRGRLVADRIGKEILALV